MINYNTFKLSSFKLLFLLIITILIGKYFNIFKVSNYYYFLIGAGICFFFISIVFYGKDKKILFNLFISLSLAFLFLSYYYQKIELKPQNHLSNYSENITAFYGKVVSYPIIKKSLNYKDCKEYDRVEYIIDAKDIKTKSGKIVDISGKIIIKSYNLTSSIEYGDWILLKNTAYPVKNNLLNGNRSVINRCAVTLNYKSYVDYLINSDIYYVSYPKQNSNFKIVKKRDLGWVENVSSYFREFLIKIESKYINKTESSLIKGLTVGYRDEINKSIQSDFKKAGVYHILAVSGLHVGLIAMFFFFLLKIFRIPQNVILILISFFLIFYVYIVGERPSVLRASIMFISGSMVFILDKDRHLLNSLFLAGVITLLWNPNWLFTPGFQLSFLATLGILLYFNRFNNFFLGLIRYKRFENKINTILSFGINKIISLFTITITAQILIIPLLIYYFNGFSIISIISNIFIVILSQLAVGMGFTLAIVSYSDVLVKILSYSLEKILQWIINLSNFFANLFFSYIDDLYVNWWIFLLYYFIILLVFHLKEIKASLLKEI